jgi:putative phosphoesterase
VFANVYNLIDVAEEGQLMANTYRVDVVSDTHGSLSSSLLDALEGADLIVHAGDFTSVSDYRHLCQIARVEACLGNNDWNMDYGPDVTAKRQFLYQGLRWQLCHYEERLDLMVTDIAICGHTHRPFVRHDLGERVLVMNPGSPTFPRSQAGATIGRIMVQEPERPGGKGSIVSAKIVQLEPDNERLSAWERWLFKRR